VEGEGEKCTGGLVANVRFGLLFVFPSAKLADS